jgi:hypothetical protein
MRVVLPLLAFGLFALPAFAAPSTPAALSGAPALAQSAPAGCPVVKRKYLSLNERFEEANTTHDGRLTLEQAKATKVMRVVATNFDAIDATHKGYVTQDDIHAWYKARRAAAHARREAADSAKS